jgi:hypothetical protein
VGRVERAGLGWRLEIFMLGGRVGLVGWLFGAVRANILAFHIHFESLREHLMVGVLFERAWTRYG